MRRAPAYLAVFVIVPLLALQPLAATAQSAATTQSPLAGHWEGTIEVPGSPLEVNLDFAVTGDTVTGNISIPAQGAKDIALIEISITDHSVSFAIAGIPGEPTFTGTIEGDTITGEFTQGGGSFPFRLTRGVPIAARARAALEGIDPVIEKALVDFGVPGLAIAVVADDQVVLSKGYGLRDVEGKEPVTADTLFAIGSTTKAFTAFVLGTLVDEGKLDWDAPLIEYLPGFRLHDTHATSRLKVRDLVIHSSGLPRHDLLWYNSSLSRQELFGRLRYLEPTRDLGEEFQYQNLMFMTAGYLAERITDTSWENLVRERIFAPLGMERTNFSVETSQADPDHALPYNLQDRAPELIPFRDISTVGPAGSINSSVGEMTQWIRLQLGGGEIDGKRLIEESTLQQMHTPHMAIAAYPTNQRVLTLGYGTGWAIESHRGHFMVQHGGGIDGFISWVALLPHDEFGVVVYTNAAGFNPVPTAVARTVIDRILGLEDGGYLKEALDQVVRAEKAQGEAKDNAEVLRKPNTSPSRELKQYAGKYEHPGYGLVEVTLENDHLRLVYNDIPVTLEHWHFDTFNGADEDGDPTFEGTKFLFRLDTGGEVAELVAPFETQTEPIVFDKLADERLSDPQYLQQFVGEYDLQSQRATVTLRGDQLSVTVPGQPPYALEPIREAEFALAGLHGFSLQFQFDEQGAVTGARFIQPNGIFEAKRVEE